MCVCVLDHFLENDQGNGSLHMASGLLTALECAVVRYKQTGQKECKN